MEMPFAFISVEANPLLSHFFVVLQRHLLQLLKIREPGATRG